MKKTLIISLLTAVLPDEFDKVTFDPKNMDHLEVYLEKHTPEKNNSLLFTTFWS